MKTITQSMNILNAFITPKYRHTLRPHSSLADCVDLPNGCSTGPNISLSREAFIVKGPRESSRCRRWVHFNCENMHYQCYYFNPLRLFAGYLRLRDHLLLFMVSLNSILRAAPPANADG